ncbi:MAG: ribonuclease R [Chitinophagales bacterium]
MSKNKKKSSGKGEKRKALNKEIQKFIEKSGDKGRDKNKVLKQFLRENSSQEIFSSLDFLTSRGKIIKTENVYKSLQKIDKSEIDENNPNVYTGQVDMTRSGAAYIICDDLNKDIYVRPQKTGKAFHRDIVKVLLTNVRKSGKNDGEILEVVKRHTDQFIGTIHLSKSFAFVVPDKEEIQSDFFVPLNKIMNAKDGEKVIVQLISWDDPTKSPLGEVINRLGKAGDNEVEMQSILIENGFNLEFPASVMDQLKKLPTKIPAEEYEKREDFRNITTFTIDPDDAQDFDDALSFEKMDNGHYKIGVHIADVSFYVRPGTPLDIEAQERCTSVYLVDRVLPMLPEKISNELCSLRPNEEKLCYSVVFEMNDRAEVKNVWYGRTIIYSDQRFTYDDAQKLIETNNKKERFAYEVKTINQLAKILRKKRFENGSIDFSSEEVKFKLDENKKPIGIEIKIMRDANRMIEDFMLLTNKYVSLFAGKPEKGKNPVPMIYRIHDTPDSTKLENFAVFAKKFGYDLKFDDPKQTAHTLNGLYAKIKGKKEQHVLETLGIRTMSKAAYSTNNIGHYGLAFDYYSHFTSPIRRYPDVLAHRIITNVLEKKKAAYDKIELEELCKKSSMMERFAMEAERDSVKYKQVEYISERIGESFEGIISGVIQRGIFVELVENKCEGFISARDLSDSDMEYDESKVCLTDTRTGDKYQIGEDLKVRVVGTNIEKRQIDLETVPEDEIEH